MTDEDEAASATSSEEAAPKKKKKKKVESEETLTDPRALALSTAFDAGDFVRVRALATELTKTDDTDLAAMGRDYLARIAVDGVQIAFLGLCLMAILTIAWIYVPH